jgi:hypothetical protein
VKRPARALGPLLALALLSIAPPAPAESQLTLAAPDPLGSFRGVVHDSEGRALGENRVENVLRADGRVYLRSEARVAGEPGNLLEAELEPIPGSALFRPLWQRTVMPLAGGRGQVELRVDHRTGRARCLRAGEAPLEVALAADERIANVPMNLALRDVAAGRQASVRFQLVLCEGWKRIVDVEVRAEPPPAAGAVQLRFGFDLGARAVSALFRPFLPDIRVWMRPEPPNEWVAHRLPLYRGGPIIAIVREGIDSAPFLAP